MKSDTLEALREKGLRCTPQRYGVLEYLRRRHIHPTAEEIYRAVNRSDPRASRATVYNNLRSLIEAGLVREVVVEGKAARFEAVTERHHHFICEVCGRIEDVPWFEVSGIARRVTGYELVMRGSCEKCQ